MAILSIDGLVCQAQKELLKGLRIILRTYTKAFKKSFSHDRRYKEEAKRTLLGSFTFPGMNERRNRIPEACEGTYTWVFSGLDCRDDIKLPAEYRSFSEWLSISQAWPEPRDVYWIKGKLGSGKSTLMSFLLNNNETLLHLSGGKETRIVSHFFSRTIDDKKQRRENLKTSMTGLYLSIVGQLLLYDDDALSALASEDNCRSKTVWSDWKQSELHRKCFQILESFPHQLIIFIDALDEADDREALLEFITRVRTCCKARLCLASRPEEDFEDEFRKSPQLRLQDVTRRDIQSYVATRIDFRKKFSVYQQWEIIELIVKTSAGVFLWVRLVVQTVNSHFRREPHPSLESVKRLILKIPNEEMEESYSIMWDNLVRNENEGRQAACLIRVVLEAEKLPILLPYWSEKICTIWRLASEIYGTTYTESFLGNRDRKAACPETNQLLEDMRSVINHRCGGFLEIVPEAMEYDSKSFLSSERFQIDCQSRVQLIHPTMYAFFEEKSQEMLLRYDGRTRDDLQIAIWKRDIFMLGSNYISDMSDRNECLSEIDSQMGAFCESGRDNLLPSLVVQDEIWSSFETLCEVYMKRDSPCELHSTSPESKIEQSSAGICCDEPTFITQAARYGRDTYVLDKIKVSNLPTTQIAHILNEVIRSPPEEIDCQARFIQELWDQHDAHIDLEHDCHHGSDSANGRLFQPSTISILAWRCFLYLNDQSQELADVYALLKTIQQKVDWQQNIRIFVDIDMSEDHESIHCIGLAVDSRAHWRLSVCSVQYPLLAFIQDMDGPLEEDAAQERSQKPEQAGGTDTDFAGTSILPAIYDPDDVSYIAQFDSQEKKEILSYVRLAVRNAKKHDRCKRVYDSIFVKPSGSIKDLLWREACILRSMNPRIDSIIKLVRLGDFFGRSKVQSLQRLKELCSSSSADEVK